MFSFSTARSGKDMEAFLQKLQKQDMFKQLDKYGQEGVRALALNTPKDSGLAASSWGYKIEIKNDAYTITWTNTNNEGGLLVVILLQYGHGTGTGGYVQGRDFINPAIQPIFDKIEREVWKAVVSA